MTPEEVKKEKQMIGDNFIPPLGDLILALEHNLADVTSSNYRLCAKLFEGTKLEAVIFSGKSFEEAASTYCLEAGWQEPS